METNVNIKLNFNIGDNLYRLQEKRLSNYEDCEACNGKGHIEVNGHNFMCETCGGSGAIMREGGKRITVLERLKITSLKASADMIMGKQDRIIQTNRIVYTISKYTKDDKGKEKAPYTVYLSESEIMEGIESQYIFYDLKSAQDKMNSNNNNN